LTKQFEVDLQALSEVTNYVAGCIDKKDVVVLLQGDLASGKTTFVKAFLAQLNIQSEVTSPTFCIQNVYDNNIFHYDVYNKSLEEFISLGLLEEFEKKGIHFVEWGDNKLEELLRSYGFDIIKLEIEKLNEKRRYTIYA
jgi:tRNA threonylcarbamoyladenosine biosynthesis protein TsaE